MSRKKGSGTSSVVVGGSGKKNHVGARPRLLVLIVGGVVMLAVLGFGLYAVYEHFAGKPKDNGSKQKTDTPPNYTSKNIAPPTSTDYSGDQAALDKDLQNAPDSAAKAVVYLKKADAVIINKGYNDDALGYAQKAEQLSPSMQSAFELAIIHEALGHKTDAAKYYSLYLARMTPEYKQANPGDYEHYQQVLQELQKS